MNKKLKKLKKGIKREMRDIDYKRSSNSLKNKFLGEQRTAIFHNGFHPLWTEYSQPMVGEVENDFLVEDTEIFLPLDVKKAT